MVIQSTKGLHMRPLSKMVDLASRYDCNAKLRFNSKEVNMKSLIDMIMLDINYQDSIELIAEGPGDKHLIIEMCALIENTI